MQKKDGWKERKGIKGERGKKSSTDRKGTQSMEQEIHNIVLDWIKATTGSKADSAPNISSKT